MEVQSPAGCEADPPFRRGESCLQLLSNQAVLEVLISRQSIRCHLSYCWYNEDEGCCCCCWRVTFVLVPRHRQRRFFDKSAMPALPTFVMLTSRDSKAGGRFFMPLSWLKGGQCWHKQNMWCCTCNLGTFQVESLECSRQASQASISYLCEW